MAGLSPSLYQDEKMNPMKENIRHHLDNPSQLETMYRADKGAFTDAFALLYPEVRGIPLADFWNERLQPKSPKAKKGLRQDLLFVLLAAIVGGLIARVPFLGSLSEENFYARNAGFILFPALTAFFAWKNRLSPIIIATLAGITLLGLGFINFLPSLKSSNTTVLSCLHLLFVLWAALGVAYTGGVRDRHDRRLSFLRFNGDLVVMTSLILIAGGIMTGLTIGLFSVLGLHIEQFYFENVVVSLLPAAPILGTYLIYANPQLVGKVSPVIARLFSPLVLVMLVIYLVAMVYTAKDPYNDREFLMIFNLLLIGVMAIIFFSVTGSPGVRKSRFEIWVLFLLSITTILVNGIALTAIVYRTGHGGITPNRVAVLGANGLMLVNLCIMTGELFNVVVRHTDGVSVGRSVARFLPLYAIWAAVVTFLFPFFFRFQ
ncbi:MAG: hypothetical protein JWP27_2605 [Flaviaesturariibacter sp.]|nr:hypothetical protein [Flaviaesturariibacter sp.]